MLVGMGAEPLLNCRLPARLEGAASVSKCFVILFCLVSCPCYLVSIFRSWRVILGTSRESIVGKVRWSMCRKYLFMTCMVQQNGFETKLVERILNMTTVRRTSMYEYIVWKDWSCFLCDCIGEWLIKEISRKLSRKLRVGTGLWQFSWMQFDFVNKGGNASSA